MWEHCNRIVDELVELEEQQNLAKELAIEINQQKQLSLKEFAGHATKLLLKLIEELMELSNLRKRQWIQLIKLAREKRVLDLRKFKKQRGFMAKWLSYSTQLN